VNGKINVLAKVGKKVSYEFEIKRKITFIRGDSGSGKSKLVELVEAVEKETRGYSIECRLQPSTQVKERMVRAVRGDWKNWKRQMEEIENSVIFFDENDVCLKKKEFAKSLLDSGNYFVIVSRRDYETIPYSVEEIYDVHNSNSPDELITGSWNYANHEYKS